MYFRDSKESLNPIEINGTWITQLSAEAPLISSGLIFLDATQGVIEDRSDAETSLIIFGKLTSLKDVWK